MPTLREIFANIFGRNKQKYCFKIDDDNNCYILPIEQRDWFEFVKEENYHLDLSNTEELQKKFGEYGTKENLENYSFTGWKLMFEEDKACCHV